jgi:hypothetical protein
MAKIDGKTSITGHFETPNKPVLRIMENKTLYTDKNIEN